MTTTAIVPDVACTSMLATDDVTELPPVTVRVVVGTPTSTTLPADVEDTVVAESKMSVASDVAPK